MQDTSVKKRQTRAASWNISTSLRLFEEQIKYFPAGVNSNARLWKGLTPNYNASTIFVHKAKGAYLWDVDGNKYIDYRLGYGPVILGHSYEKIHKAVEKAEANGLVYALDNEYELKVAKLVRSMVPCAEKMRFANSGTEATMAAVRLARAYTGKEKIVKFEGHFHGTHDYVLFSTDGNFSGPLNEPVPMSLGIPKAIKDLVLVEQWNDFEAIEKLVKEHHQEIAAIITEPIMGNASAIVPKDGYLRHLKELCDSYNIVLIFDEVKTGFRLRRGGAQEMFGVVPHLATYAKSMGNGYPIAMFAGFEELMDLIGPHMVAHGGTYSANPVSLAACEATLKEYKKNVVFNHLQSYGKRLINGMISIFDDHKIPHIISGRSQMFQMLFTKQESVYTYRDLKHCNMDFYAKLQHELLTRGVMIDEDNEEVIFLSYSHGKKELDTTLKAIDDSIDAAKVMRSNIDVHK